MNPQGCYTALVTPFKEGNVDEDALVRLIRHQLEGSIDGLVLCGTTGELSLLSEKEHQKILEIGIKTVASACPVIASVASPSTTKALQQAQMAHALGASALLVLTPYYVKATSEGVFAHFKMIHDQVNLPLILYNNPARTGFEIDEALLDRLLSLERVVGLKDSTANLSRIQRLGERFKNSDFAYICGDDALIEVFLEHHAKGWISVISHLYPQRCVLSLRDGNDEILEEVKASIRALEVEAPNPVPIKYALSSHLRLCLEDVRLPLLPLSTQEKAKIDQGLKR